MKSLTLICCLLINGCSVIAQGSIQKIKTPVQFQSILQAGLLTGQSESAYEVQTINGIKHKTFSAGMGVGIDNYVFRTVPVFLDVRKDILIRKNSPFVFADAGTQFCWVQNNQKDYSYFNPEYKSKFYFNAGAGYKINLLKNNAIILSAAFSLKRVEEIENPYCDFVACPEQQPIINKYAFTRLSLKAGWMIW